MLDGTVEHWKWCTWHRKASAKNSNKLNKFLHSEVNLLIQHISFWIDIYIYIWRGFHYSCVHTTTLWINKREEASMLVYAHYWQMWRASILVVCTILLLQFTNVKMLPFYLYAHYWQIWWGFHYGCVHAISLSIDRGFRVADTYSMTKWSGRLVTNQKFIG